MSSGVPASGKLMIIGASVRAAAQSARRAALSVTAIDRFGDADLAECAERVAVAPCRAEMIAAAKEMERMPWMYTGALENDPRAVDEISRRHPLEGNSARVLRGVRDPWCLAAALRSEGMAFPEMIPPGEPLPVGKWLCKPRNSAAGRLIQAVRCDQPQVPQITVPEEPWYWQRYVSGCSMGLVFVANGRQSELVGITRQLVGIPWCGSRPFQYAGSVGPVECPAERIGEYRTLGDVLAARFALRGIFGVDVIDDGTRAWVLEVNPRWTAGAEILEQSLGTSLVGTHLPACREGLLPSFQPPAKRRYRGKIILYARRRLWASDRLHAYVDRVNGRCLWPRIADVPVRGSQIEPGRPALTVFAEGESAERVIGSLKRRVLKVESLMARPAKSND